MTAEAQEQSFSVFGNRHLAAILAAAADRSDTGDALTVRHLATDTGIVDSVVRPVALRLAAAGILQALPREGARGAQYYMLARGTVPEHAVRLARAINQPEHSAQPGGRTPRPAP